MNVKKITWFFLFQPKHTAIAKNLFLLTFNIDINGTTSSPSSWAWYSHLTVVQTWKILKRLALCFILVKESGTSWHLMCLYFKTIYHKSTNLKHSCKRALTHARYNLSRNIWLFNFHCHFQSRKYMATKETTWDRFYCALIAKMLHLPAFVVSTFERSNLSGCPGSFGGM